jgi:solute:Na+ symporter, SSS family
MSNFSWPIDGSIVGCYLLATMIAGIMVRKYVGKVEHFIVAGREMNVYLGIASLAATEFGIITCMYTAQSGYQYGFAGATPGILMALAMFFVGITGFCIKPLRDSGVMTIPELLEKRFGPRIRWATGVVIVLGGMLTMGLFLRIGGEFLVLVSGFDIKYLEIAMTVFLAVVSIYTILGGMLSVLVTDFLQFVVMSGGLIVVTCLILFRIGWSRLVTCVEIHYGAAGFNPFLNPQMGWEYVVYFSLVNLSVVLTWQTITARVLSAKDTPTGRKIYTRTAFFFVCRFLIPGIWGIAALAMLTPDHLVSLSPEMQEQVSLYGMPVFLSTFVPVGFMGILIAALIAADMSTDSSYMLTWGSVIYNDILAPFRKTPWTEKKGLLWNRMIVACIGVFLLIYGLWYKLESDLWTYLSLTSTIYTSSISVILVACCYWKRANSWGAAGAIIIGALIPCLFLVTEKLPITKDYIKRIGPYYPGMATYFFTVIAMVVGSLLRPSRLQPKI